MLVKPALGNPRKPVEAFIWLVNAHLPPGHAMPSKRCDDPATRILPPNSNPERPSRSRASSRPKAPIPTRPGIDRPIPNSASVVPAPESRTGSTSGRRKSPETSHRTPGLADPVNRASRLAKSKPSTEPTSSRPDTSTVPSLPSLPVMSHGGRPASPPHLPANSNRTTPAASRTKAAPRRLATFSPPKVNVSESGNSARNDPSPPNRMPSRLIPSPPAVEAPRPARSDTPVPFTVNTAPPTIRMPSGVTSNCIGPSLAAAIRKIPASTGGTGTSPVNVTPPPGSGTAPSSRPFTSNTPRTRTSARMATPPIRAAVAMGPSPRNPGLYQGEYAAKSRFPDAFMGANNPR